MATTFCYVVLAHRPEGLDRLVRRIRRLTPTAGVVVRFEAGGLIDADLVRCAGALPLSSRIRGRWGSWDLTEVMLEALGMARSCTDADYFVLISGQDYPIRSLTTWEREVAAAGFDALLEPIKDSPHDYTYRWSIVAPPVPPFAGAQRVVRHLAWRTGQVTRPVLQILPRFAEGDRRMIVGVRRLRPRPPAGIRVTKCSQWMTLSAKAVDRVLRVDREHPDLRRYFRTVRISDESYVQSLVHAEGDLRVVHGETTVKRFVPPVASPVWLDEESLTELASASAAPFARKFSPDVPDEVVRLADRLADQDLAARPGVHPL